MHTTRLRRRSIVLMFIVISMGVLFQSTTRRYEKQRDALVLARIHIADSVEPLCREVLPQEDKLLFLSNPLASTKAEGDTARLWEVECLDGQREPRLRLLWNDADTCLVSLYRLNLHQTRLPQPVTSRERAIGEARLWVERLGIVPHGTAQQCVASVEMENGAYDVHLRLREQSVTVCINYYSNDLRFVYIMRPDS